MVDLSTKLMISYIKVYFNQSKNFFHKQNIEFFDKIKSQLEVQSV
jgi:hypothetical protein